MFLRKIKISKDQLVKINLLYSITLIVFGGSEKSDNMPRNMPRVTISLWNMPRKKKTFWIMKKYKQEFLHYSLIECNLYKCPREDGREILPWNNTFFFPHGCVIENWMIYSSVNEAMAIHFQTSIVYKLKGSCRWYWSLIPAALGLHGGRGHDFARWSWNTLVELHLQNRTQNIMHLVEGVEAQRDEWRNN